MKHLLLYSVPVGFLSPIQIKRRMVVWNKNGKFCVPSSSCKETLENRAAVQLLSTQRTRRNFVRKFAYLLHEQKLFNLVPLLSILRHNSRYSCPFPLHLLYAVTKLPIFMLRVRNHNGFKRPIEQF